MQNVSRKVVRFEDEGFAKMNLPGLEEQDVWWKNISFDEATGQGSYLMIMGPGTRSNPHRHNGFEEFFIVEGDLEDHDGHLYRAGDMVCLVPGSEHFSVSCSGCKLMVTQRGTTTEYLHGDWAT